MEERTLAAAVVAWLRAQHYTVYQEVQANSYDSIADIVVDVNARAWVIECKRSFGLAVLEDAYRWQGWGASRVSVAVPRTSSHCTELRAMHGVLQRVNPQATRTTLGCIRSCPFCGVRRIEGRFRELDDWPDLPIICDNNLLAASYRHFDRVIDRLVRWSWCDFNQGLDARLLTPYHASRIAEIHKPIVRLALDSDSDRTVWQEAVEMLRHAGVAKSCIRTYVLCGFDASPEADWQRCEFVESFGIKALPMWFHSREALEHNSVTPAQRKLGWSEKRQRQLMGWYYRHRGCKPALPMMPSRPPHPVAPSPRQVIPSGRDERPQPTTPGGVR